ncbi:alpha-L-fucosidase [Pedobacter cryoconitis]|uniref:alpha-L-fucosidase n=1 Tax=Pedobacter cryoconitis TaxID=188932 RepID=UPI0016177844|nr:alpha-L-fucosidase [Pedobacter cryoconitis]MBB5645015.1 alpha-L-fucosidase [Pedobacter cryoconitis]
MKIKIIIAAMLICAAGKLAAQENGVHQQSTVYEWPEDPLVKKKLDKWQDQKFGMIIHWGLYAVPGIIESWSLCSEDWIERDSTKTYDDYKKWYWGLSKAFNPVHFNPEQWAKAGKSAGMKYLVFTTKHHDGFAMFDTRESDFSIAKGPFANNPKADVAKYVFDSFRKEGFMIGAYFSKPDWHSEYYWWSKYATPNRNNNYDIQKNPWRWNKFKGFAYNQLEELMTRYGGIDILWLDGGWVRPLETVNEEVRSWGADIPKWSQDIDMPEIARMARKAQPGILMVDRTVHGPYENYQTPEQKIPDTQLDHPWESCMTLGGAWGFVPNDQYKPASEVIHKLVEIVAKGGSLLLGIGPDPDGTLPASVVTKLNEIGQWTSKNGKAIYNTRITKNYHSGQTWFTQSKDGKLKYAIYCRNVEEHPAKTISWTGNLPKKGTVMKLVSTGQPLKWTISNEQITVELPADTIGSEAALSFEFIPAT